MKNSFHPLFIIYIIITAIFWIWFYISPDHALHVYTNGFFVWIRRIMTSLPLWLLIILWLFFIVNTYRLVYASAAVKKLSLYILRYAMVLGVVLCTYYWLWGFNYLAKQPGEEYVTSEMPAIEKDHLLQTFQEQTMRINNLRLQLDTAVFKRSVSEMLAEHNTAWSTSVQTFLNDYKYKTKGKTRVYANIPEGFLLKIGTAGFYNFLIGRPVVDPGLHTLQVPFTAVHELMHGYGVANEASANFLAYLVCASSEDTLTAYSAELSFWRSLYHACNRMDSVATQTLYSMADPSITQDLISIRRKMDAYPDIAPTVRDWMYDTFLKSQGVEAGLDSYEMYVEMVIRHRQEEDGD